MARKRYSDEDILKLLRVIEVHLSSGSDISTACRSVEYTRRALCVHVKARMGATEVLEALYPHIIEYGKPEYIRSDNGPEFIATALQKWLVRIGIKPIQIYAGSPWENGYNERFNGTLRREILNAEWFITTKQAQTVIKMKQFHDTKACIV